MQLDSIESPGRYRFLDLSGFIVSGKQAYSDLIREFTGYLVPAPEFEFELIRIQGGIRDLENALVSDWSPIRADAAIRKFKLLCRRFGSRNRLSAPSTWFSAVGWNYDAHFGGRFFELAAAYVQKLSVASWRTNWPYPRADLCDHDLFTRKLFTLLGSRKAMDFEINLAGPGGFLEATRCFLEGLMATRALPDTKTIVTHNAFEPFNPTRAIRYFSEARCIVIDRDPRDSFVAMAPHRHLALEVGEFIARFRLYREQVQNSPAEKGLVLRTRFEDLVLDYEATVNRVLGFLGEDRVVHTDKQAHFMPSSSAKNVGIWKTHPNQKDIERISRELRAYCDPRVD